MTQTPYLFCRYTLSIDDENLSPYEQAPVLHSLKGKLCSHRKPSPTAEDHDTRLIVPRDRTVKSKLIISWYVDLQVFARTQYTYDDANDKLLERQGDVKEDRVTKFIALPELGVVAIDDSSSERNIGGLAAAGRFKSVFRSVPGGKAQIDFSGSNADVERALRTWGLYRVDYSLRPFNPTPRSPGDKLDALLKADKAAKIQGSVVAHQGGRMHYSEDGFLAQAWGLAAAGYGQLGVRGETPQGLEAAFRKPTFNEERSKNIAQQEKPRQLRVFIPDHPEEAQQEEEVVKALLEFYDRPDQTPDVR